MESRDEMQCIIVDEKSHGQRVDKYLSNYFGETKTRSYIQKLIKDGLVEAAGQQIKANYKVSKGDQLKITIPTPVTLDVIPEDIPLDIVYEDEDVILINKGKDMVVHPAPGHESGTIVNAVLHHCEGNLSGINGVLRPGIVHRIDKDTTGIIIICKNDRAHNDIANQLKEHTIVRKYRAIVYNNIPEDEGVVDAPIGRNKADRKKMGIDYQNGKRAVTHYKVLERFGKYTYIECQLETGRTHQIRVHMAKIGHPLLGDTVYGPAKNVYKLEGQALHAKVLGFVHPRTKEYMEFDSKLPEYFEKLLEKLRNSL